MSEDMSIKQQQKKNWIHLDECDFSQLTASDWSHILVLRPDLVDKFESIERDWSKDDDQDDIEQILQDSP